MKIIFEKKNDFLNNDFIVTEKWRTLKVLSTQVQLKDKWQYYRM